MGREAKPGKARDRKKKSQKKEPAGKKSKRTTRKKVKQARKAAGSILNHPQAAQVLLHLEDLLRERIHGKNQAVERIAQAIRVRLTQLDFRPERPNGSFLIVGPPGVGKNEFAYAVAHILYGDESVVVGIDMRGVTSEEEVSRLSDTVIPGPPSILLEGALTTPVRRRPHSILLLRGVEHGHPAAHRLIQQIIEEGWLDDASGRVSFSSTLVFATSRIPEEEMGPAGEIGFTSAPKSFEERIREKMTRRLGEEFLDSFQEFLVIPPLSADDVRKIARYKVETVLERLQKVRRGVVVADSVYQTFIPDTVVASSGAGTLNRTLESKLLNPLARYLLEHPQDRAIRVDVRDGSLVIEPAPRIPAAKGVKASGG